MKLPDDVDNGRVDLDDAPYSMSFEGQDAPMRPVTYLDRSQLGDGLTLSFTTYRTLTTVEVEGAVIAGAQR